MVEETLETPLRGLLVAPNATEASAMHNIKNIGPLHR
jgi:hypothetical protein